MLLTFLGRSTRYGTLYIVLGILCTQGMHTVMMQTYMHTLPGIPVQYQVLYYDTTGSHRSRYCSIEDINSTKKMTEFASTGHRWDSDSPWRATPFLSFFPSWLSFQVMAFIWQLTTMICWRLRNQSLSSTMRLGWAMKMCNDVLGIDVNVY